MSQRRASRTIRESVARLRVAFSSTVQHTLASNPIGQSEIWRRTKETLSMNWYLGFTAFGSPPVHFQIYHKKFVEKHQWIDEQLYQELFGLSQALPGPASTKMLYCINYIRNGFWAGVLTFFLWSLPGALAMFGLSLGVAGIGDTLPTPIYALLSGLNAATVGIIALAAVQLAEKAITDKVTRVLVFFGGAAGMLYTALWYYPILMVGAGLVTVISDYRWLNRLIRPFRSRRPEQGEELAVENASTNQVVGATSSIVAGEETARSAHLRRGGGPSLSSTSAGNEEHNIAASESTLEESRVVPPGMQINLLTWQTGTGILVAFLSSFLIIILLRSLLKTRPIGLALFGNLYLAGTIIFGGGPVVIPLLREYVVAEGWVSPRDFLLGLAIIQAFPGPNFNFAVYLGALTVKKSASGLPSIVGALLAFIAIFTPGLVIMTGMMGLWSLMRSKRWFLSLLRGVNAAAVGLVFTAVYKLWQIGFVDASRTTGTPLGGDPWWVVVTAGSFVGGKWFGISAPLAILFGGALGLVWYGVVG